MTNRTGWLSRRLGAIVGMHPARQRPTSDVNEIVLVGLAAVWVTREDVLPVAVDPDLAGLVGLVEIVKDGPPDSDMVNAYPYVTVGMDDDGMVKHASELAFTLISSDHKVADRPAAG